METLIVLLGLLGLVGVVGIVVVGFCRWISRHSQLEYDSSESRLARAAEVIQRSKGRTEAALALVGDPPPGYKPFKFGGSPIFFFALAIPEGMEGQIQPLDLSEDYPLSDLHDWLKQLPGAVLYWDWSNQSWGNIRDMKTPGLPMSLDDDY